jgi:hypothetical protein
MSDPIRTPTSIVVLAACPSCSLQQPLRVYLNAELVISDEGSVLALKAKASKAEHICGQLSLEDAGRSIVQPLLDLADKYGPITIEHKGRTVDIGTGEILTAYRALVEDGETLDAALARLEAREDYAEVIGSPAGQALLELLKDEPGAFVPFPTPEQLREQVTE